ncbi:E3 ubiquitin-protein ligase UBR3 [Lamellibrachia satsuma]|nr:E3 ubiquitin-protein ligase UBR3 [Lamellibrachia satsuma]
MCGLVWTADFVAYRCRTCGISPCMSLCADCFQAGNHTGHDFNMFRSQAGGACDCGDISVMKACGFCQRHGPQHQQSQQGAPPDLLAVAEVMMPRLIFRLVQHMRDHCAPDMLDTYSLTTPDWEQYVSLLHSFSAMGAAMRHVIAKAVTNPHVYTYLTQGVKTSTDYHQRSRKHYDAALKSLTCPAVPDEFKDEPGLDSPLQHTTLLDELLFWTVKFEFPQKIVTFLLSLLPDDSYKEAFTKAFIQHYSRISVALVNSLDRSRISNRVVHISVQLLSPEGLACKMVDEHHLLPIMLGSLRHMLNGVLVCSTINNAEENFHLVVDCAKDVLKQHCCWPIVSDLINVLSHKPIAYKFMQNEQLLHFWFDLLACFQGMNLNQREMTQHVEYEPETYYAAFSAELEICASPMWSQLVHCKEQSTCLYTRTVIQAVAAALQDWFDAIGTQPHSRPNPMQVSFHLPLHRYFAVFVSQAVQNQGQDLAELLPSNEFLQMALIHPLQLQVVFHEILCGMWVRNGLQIRGQAMTYIQCHFCNSMVDADLFLLQICATKLDADYFVKMVLERFHLWDVLSFVPPGEVRPKLGLLDAEHQMPMLEGALTFLCTLLSVRTLLGLDEAELTRQEMASLLCIADRTHSHLMDMMPEKCGLTGQTKHFESTLKEVADYKAPNFEAGGAMQQGMYVPKGDIWVSSYNPLHVLLRAMYRKDFQASMDRYTKYVRQNGLYKGTDSPWPPFRLPGRIHPAYIGLRRLLHCRTMHGLLFTLLHKVCDFTLIHKLCDFTLLHKVCDFTLLHKAVNEPSVPDAVIYLAVYLLEMSVSTPSTTLGQRTEVSSSPRDQQYSTWFPCDSIFVNLRHVIKKVVVTLQATPTPPSTNVTNLEELFHLAPSAMSISGSGVSVVAAMLPSSVIDAMESMLANDGVSTSTTPQYVSQGVSADLDSELKTMSVDIDTSMLELLLKLHAKMSGKQNSYIPVGIRSGQQGDQPQTESRIGDGLFFVGNLLDKICRLSEECSRFVIETYRRNVPEQVENDVEDRELSDREERRRRVRERQQKLMAEFASKQKEFMEKVLVDEEEGQFDSEAEQDKGANSATGKQMYDCVICNQATASTGDRPLGLVALLQPTSVLGHSQHCEDPAELPVSGTMPSPETNNRAAEFNRRVKRMLEHFNENSCLLSVNIGWEGGVHIQTCGHYVHLDCHRSYLESLKTPSHQHSLQVNKGDFWCPLCRRLANSALPILPDPAPATSVLPQSDVEMVHYIASTMATRPVTPGTSPLTQAMGWVMEFLTNTTYPRYKTISTSHTAEGVLLFVCSVLRTNLELELLQRTECSPCLPVVSSLVSKKSCIVPLLNVLSMHSKILTMTPYTELWSYITGVGSNAAGKSTSVAVYHEEVPLLLKDASALLIQLVLTMPATMQQETYQCILKVLYNVVYMQALTVMSCTFSEEERVAWSSRSKDVSFTSLEGLLHHVIDSLNSCGLYQELLSGDRPMPAVSTRNCCQGTDPCQRGQTHASGEYQELLSRGQTHASGEYQELLSGDRPMPAICQSVWSPQSVETCVQEFCLPFLRLAALLHQHMYGVDLPQLTTPNTAEEFRVLSRHLCLVRSEDAPPPCPLSTSPSLSPPVCRPTKGFLSAAGVHWFCGDPRTLVQLWCCQFAQSVDQHPASSRLLLMTSPTWKSPQLLKLPHLFDQIFQFYRQKQCHTCHSQPKDPSLCLVCGQLVCFKERCCQQQNVFECVQHSIDCGGGTGMFIIVNSSLIVVIRGPRATIWGSVYLDEHGEEDRDLKRGKPLYLSKERYGLLREQWLTHSYDKACKRWIFHQDKL